MVSKETVEHYTWGDGCDGWHLVQRPELSVIHERMPPGTHEVRHLHGTARQFFFVLSGAVTIEIDGRREVLRAHQGVEVPPGAPHQVLNESQDDVEFVVISHPTTRGDRVPAEREV